MSKDTSWSGTPPERWAAFYVRVTKEESVTKDLSIPNQIARAKEIAQERGWKAFRLYVEPRHVSGELWVDKRPALKALVDDVAAGRVERVCARHTDRLWRSTAIQSRLLSLFRAHGVELWDYSHNLDYRSAHGCFSLQVLGAASELEVSLTAERIREMKRGKAQRGKPGGGPPPYGYTSQSRRLLELVRAGLSRDEAYKQACTEFPVGKCWYVDPKEAEVVRLIFTLYTSPRHRMGCRRICQFLDRKNYRSRTGQRWLSNYVTRLLKLLGDTAAVAALLDRLLHHAHVLKCGPRSWRTKTADLKTGDATEQLKPRLGPTPVGRFSTDRVWPLLN